MSENGDRPHVVIVGAGFGGLNAARTLRGAPVRITLIDRNNYHLFQPLLYQVATAGLEPEQIAKPIRAILRDQSNLRFRMAEVEDVDLERRRLHTNLGSMEYDYLVMAVGAQTDFFQMENLERSALDLKGLDDAIHVRNHVLRCFERAAIEDDPQRRKDLLTFLIVGGGPTGVEMAGAISELIHLVLLRDYPELSREDVRVLLFEAVDQVLPGFPRSLGEAARDELADKGIEVRLEEAVEDYDGRAARLANGEVVPSETLIWAAGVKAHGIVRQLGVELARSRRVPVEATLQLPDHPTVFVVGDAAHREADGKPLPMMAPVAIQMAKRAAENIERLVQGKSPEPFEYRDPGSLATIGRNAAVADVFGLQFTGFVAWVVWLVVHLIQLIGFRNRLVVLINWAWDYFFYDRAVRLITGE